MKSARRLRSRQTKACARPDQFAESLCVRVYIAEQFIAGLAPGLQSAAELTHVGVTQRRQAIRRRGHKAFGHKTFAGVVHDDRHILPWKPRFGFERNPVSSHLGGEQGMAGGEGGFVPQSSSAISSRSNSMERTCEGVTERTVM